MPVAIVVLAAGSGSRVGAEVNKVLLPLGYRSVLAWSVTTALSVADLAQVVVVVRPGEEAAVSADLAPHLGAREVLLTPGGPTRHESEWAALRVFAPSIETGEIDVVAIHDGARPLAESGLYEAVIDAAREHGGALPVLGLHDCVRTPASGGVARPLTNAAATIQTPQAFAAGTLLASYRAAERDGFEGTDTAACVAAYADVRIAAVRGQASNIKVTFAEDVALATRLRQRSEER